MGKRVVTCVGAVIVVLSVVTTADRAGATDNSRAAIDRDGNGVDALSVARVSDFPDPPGPGHYNWFFQDQRTSTAFQGVQCFNQDGFPTTCWGSANANDRLVPADYDGDSMVDVAVYRPGSPASTWIIENSGANPRVTQTA